MLSVLYQYYIEITLTKRRRSAVVCCCSRGSFPSQRKSMYMLIHHTAEVAKAILIGVALVDWTSAASRTRPSSSSRPTVRPTAPRVLCCKAREEESAGAPRRIAGRAAARRADTVRHIAGGSQRSRRARGALLSASQVGAAGRGAATQGCSCHACPV